MTTRTLSVKLKRPTSLVALLSLFLILLRCTSISRVERQNVRATRSLDASEEQLMTTIPKQIGDSRGSVQNSRNGRESQQVLDKYGRTTSGEADTMHNTGTGDYGLHRVASHLMRNSSFIQLFVVTAASKKAYRDRFLANHEGWHQDFPSIQAYTFDHLLPNDTIRSLVHQLPKVRMERKPAASGNNWNLLLASFGAIYDFNPNATWYFMAEDDTVLVTQNLEKYLLMHDDTTNDDHYEGKCVYVIVSWGSIEFVMGGSGILMNGSLLKKLAPHITGCRNRLTRGGYGDTRIAKCMDQKNITVESTCSKHRHRFLFSSGSAWEEMSRKDESKNHLMISIHEKDPDRIRFLNSLIRNLTLAPVTNNNHAANITYATLKPYLEQYNNSRYDEVRN